MSAIRDQPITSVREGVFLMCDSGVTGYDEEERGRSKVDRQPHKLAGEGSSPSPATRLRTPNDVIRFFERITYKPGYKFSVWLNDEDHIEHRTVTLNLKIPVPDSTTVDHREVTIAYTQKVPVEHLIRGGTNLALNIVQMFFSGWERHEMDEWFRLDGKMIRDPHAGDTQ